MTAVERLEELIRDLAKHEQHLADCEARKPTRFLRELMMYVAATPQLDFDYLAELLLHGIEQDRRHITKELRKYEGLPPLEGQ